MADGVSITPAHLYNLEHFLVSIFTRINPEPRLIVKKKNSCPTEDMITSLPGQQASMLATEQLSLQTAIPNAIYM